MIKVGLYIVAVSLFVFSVTYYNSVLFTFGASFLSASLAALLLGLHKIKLKWNQTITTILIIISILLLNSYYVTKFSFYKYGLLTWSAFGTVIAIIGVVKKYQTVG